MQDDLVKRRTCGLLAATALFLGGVAFATAPAWAVDDLGLFELDENAADPDTALPDDWQNVNSNGGNSNENAFLPDVSSASDNVLTGGSTKDDIDFPSWEWKFAKATPDKDNITNAYAAAYQDSNDHLIIYFGADRFAVNGDAQVGFWFLQDEIGTVNPAGMGQNGTFTGVHEDGDILVLAHFLQGGAVGEVQVFEWIEGGGNEGNANLFRLGDFGECLGGPDDACAVTNNANTASFWAYTPKSGPPGVFPPAAFFEGGIDITAFFGDSPEETPCFTSFLAETRASQSVDATLKDFALGDFEVCETAALKVCNQDPDDAVFVPATGEVQYQVAGLVTNTGLGSATVTSVTDSPAFDSGSLMLFELDSDPGSTPSYDDIVNAAGGPISLPFELAPNERFGWSATITGSNGVMDTVTVESQATVGGTDLLDATADANCPVKKVDGGISVTKTCDATFVPIEAGVDDRMMIQVEISGTVTNEGEIELTNVTVIDDTYSDPNDPLVLFGPGETLDPEETANWGPVTINPTTDREPDAAPQCRFTDDVTATGEADPNFTNESGTCVLTGDVIVCTATADATCALCGISVE